MSEDKKRAPAPVSADVGARPKAYDNKDSIAQPGEECKHELGYFAVVPIAIMRDKRLPDSAKLLYCHISALTRAEGYCYATNAFLGEMQGISPSRVGELLAVLERLSYLERNIIRDPKTNAVQRREIRLFFDVWSAGNYPPKNRDSYSEEGATPPPKNRDTCHEKGETPPPKNRESNNISSINYTPYSPPEGDGERCPKKKKALTKTGPEAWAILDSWSDGKPIYISDLLHKFVDTCRDNPIQGKKSPMSEAAAKIFVKKLDEYSGGNESYLAAMLEETIERGWKSVYPLKIPPITPLNPDTPPDALLPGENAEDYLWIED